MSTTALRAAAQARRAATAQRSYRPRDRRNSQGDEMPHAAFQAALTVRESADSSQVGFRGIASAYERAYEMFDAFGPYEEIVGHGAGKVTLAQSDLNVPLVLGHDQMRRIASTANGTLTLRETQEGLEVNAPNLNLDDHDVAYILPKLRDGLINEMSFAFRIVSGIWSPDFTQYRIEEFDIHRGDVSLVGFGANPYTSAELRNQKTWAELIPIEQTRLLKYI